MTNGVFMPYVLVFNRPAIEGKIGRVAGYLGIVGGFDGFLKAVIDLRKNIGVPETLAGLNVDGSKRELIADMAIVDPTAGGNPVPLTREGALAIFDMALSGRLSRAELANA
jgi:alcohol dehydrogenase